MKGNKGFTLIELIAVIVILGILAVTAVPTFLDLRNDARNAAAGGVGGAIASGAMLNYAKGMASSGATTVAVTGCVGTQVGNLLTSGTVTASDATHITVGGLSYTLSGVASGSLTSNGQSTTCTITHPDGGSAQSFVIVGCMDATGC